MRAEPIIKAMLKQSGLEDEALYLKKKCGKSEELPWSKYLESIHTDFDILLPEKLDEDDKKTILGYILFSSYELKPSIHPRIYYLEIDGKPLHLFDDDEIGNLIIQNSVQIVINLYHAEQKDEADKCYHWIQSKVNSLNNSDYILQEKDLRLSYDYSISEVSKKNGRGETVVFKSIQEITNRIDASILDNLNSFYYKIALVIDKNSEIKEQMTFVNFMLEEIKNGGHNINEPSDLLPLIKNLTLN